MLLLLVQAGTAFGQSPRLSNLSTRGQVGTGSNIMISGLVIGQGDPDTVLIRAIGPSLGPLGVSGFLAQPALTLFDSAGNQIAFNQGYANAVTGQAGVTSASAALMASVGAFALSPGTLDSALVATLPTGSYTAQVSGVGGTSGVALLEIYEVNATSTTAKLINLSTRGEVGTGGSIMISGLTLGPGSGNRTLLVRASGPALTALGVAGALGDPTFTMVSTAGGTVGGNDNWGSASAAALGDTTMAQVFQSAGAFSFATGSLDAASVVSLPSGGYTVEVSGNNGETGVSLVEVYDVTPAAASAPSGPSTVSLAATDAAADTSGSNPGAFTVTRTGDTSQPLNVSYTVSGTALNGIDYQGLSGTVTVPADSTSAAIAVVPNPTLSTSASTTVVVTLASGTGYVTGTAASGTVTITNIPPTLYVAQLRPTSGAGGSTASGTASILLSSDGSIASVSVSFSDLSSGEVVAHLAIGGDNNNGTYVLNLPNGQVTSLSWTPTASGAYSAAQVVAALTSGNLYVEIDSANFPSGELGGQFITGTGSTNFTTPQAPPGIDLSTVSAVDAPRFLTQATFGATTTDIATLQSTSYAGWIGHQIALPETSHRAATDADLAANPVTGQTVANQNNRMAAWWLISVTGQDQLRQRVAFALSEIFVISDVDSAISGTGDGLADYYDLLANDAFGNFRTLLQDVTLSPAMGNYLNMLHNAKANPTKGTAADENYAREVQQLFTIGLNQLQPDGTLLLGSNGLPVPTYDQDEIVQMANVFTGWGYNSTATNPSFYGTTADFDDPMMLYPAYHDTTQKTIVGGLVLPAGQTGTVDLQQTLDALFNHANTGPFFCQQLIQKLVTSNPSPGYVYRVAQVFANDGTGVRGNLAAVVKAILLDYEARSLAVAADDGFGKLKEPLLRTTQLYRAFNAASSSGRYTNFNPQGAFDEAALRSPTVFNFFPPDYVQPGALATAGLLAPEFQITNASTQISVPNYFYSSVYTSATPSASTVVLDLSAVSALSATPSSMVSLLNQLLCANGMTAATQTQITNALTTAPSNSTPTALAQMAVYLVVTSPDAAIQR